MFVFKHQFKDHNPKFVSITYNYDIMQLIDVEFQQVFKQFTKVATLCQSDVRWIKHAWNNVRIYYEMMLNMHYSLYDLVFLIKFS